jgi:hypothetical protein
MKAVDSSETLANVRRSTRRHVAEDSNRHPKNYIAPSFSVTSLCNV